MTRPRSILSAGVAAATLLAAAVGVAAATPTAGSSPSCAELSDACHASAAAAPCASCVEGCCAAGAAAGAATAVSASATAVAACHHRWLELDAAAARVCWPLYHACLHGGSGYDARRACGGCKTECAEKHPVQARECADRD